MNSFSVAKKEEVERVASVGPVIGLKLKVSSYGT